MTKRIKFYSVETSLDIAHPIPAAKAIPKWYKNVPGVVDGVMSVKKCIPVLDALTAGYVIPLPADVYWDSNSKTFLSQALMSMERDHHQSQVTNVDSGDLYDPEPHKWINQWYVKVPKGYSVLFTHPLNREDLPFRSFSGLVDCDKHPVPVNFPFLLKKGFDGLIPAGTPMIQLILVKRENWVSKVIDTGKSYVYDKSYEVFLPPFGWYKRNFWTRKKYQ